MMMMMMMMIIIIISIIIIIIGVVVVIRNKQILTQSIFVVSHQESAEKSELTWLGLLNVWPQREVFPQDFKALLSHTSKKRKRELK